MSQKLPDFYTLGPLPQFSLGPMEIPTYYFIISLAFCIGIFWFYKRCENRNLPTKNALDICLIALISGFVGARLFHILFEFPSYYLNNPIEAFYFWQGGFVFYGGFITAYLCSFLYVRKLKLTFWLWHDTLAPVVAFGYAMGRLACFLVGCCYGKVCHWPWAVPLKQVNIHTGMITSVLRHPTQIYASASEFLILIFLLLYEKKKPALGNVFLLWLLLHSTNRFIMEIFRDDPRGGFYANISLSMIISIILFSVSAVILFKRKKEAS